MKYFLHKKSRQSGFTLIEMIVSLGIFTVVAVVAIGALLKVMDANRKSINLKNATNNINFALESMSREMRVGRNYSCTNTTSVTIPLDSSICNVSDSNWTIAFTSSKKNILGTCNLIYAYRFDKVNTKLEKAQQDSTTSDCTSPVSNFSDLTSSSIKITDSIVRVDNAIKKQPYIFIFLKGYSGVKEKDKVDFSIQTSVSQRIK